VVVALVPVPVPAPVPVQALVLVELRGRPKLLAVIEAVVVVLVEVVVVQLVGLPLLVLVLLSLPRLLVGLSFWSGTHPVDPLALFLTRCVWRWTVLPRTASRSSGCIVVGQSQSCRSRHRPHRHRCHRQQRDGPK